MKICRSCGFIKSDEYQECQDCKVGLEDFEGYEEYPIEESLLR